jgi:hypothetical protein
LFSLFSVVVGENVVEKLLLLVEMALVLKKEEEEDEREHRRWFETTATLEGAIISFSASRIRVEFYGEIVNVKRG